MQEYFKSPAIPLESFLLFSLLADFWELFFIVLPCFALLGFPAWIIFYPVHFLLPCFHQLIITLTDFLFLLNSKSKLELSKIHQVISTCHMGKLLECPGFSCSSPFHYEDDFIPNFQQRGGEEVGHKNVDVEYYTLFLCFTHPSGIC